MVTLGSRSLCPSKHVKENAQIDRRRLGLKWRAIHFLVLGFKVNKTGYGLAVRNILNYSHDRV